MAGVDRYGPPLTPHTSGGPGQQATTRGKGHQTGRHTDGQHLCSAAEREREKLVGSSPGGLSGWSPPVDLSIINETTFKKKCEIFTFGRNCFFID